MPADAVFITRLAAPEGDGEGPRLAVKDTIDVAGTVTTLGSKLVASEAAPAEDDAACVRAARGAGARIVGKTNLVELAFGAEGVNPWYGTPRNPRDPSRVPGGSSSGSAVAVATGEADVAFGTDTAGSVRIPAACCGVYGLKTSYGRVAHDGVWQLAPSLDTVGPLAASLDGLALGMRLLDPGFRPVDGQPRRVGRVRPPAAPAIDEALDAALGTLAARGTTVSDVDPSGWIDAWHPTMTVLDYEAAQRCRPYLARAGDIDPVVAERLSRSAQRTRAEYDAARHELAAWRRELEAYLAVFDVLALPTIAEPPPLLDDYRNSRLTALTAPVNGGGNPALAMPVGVGASIPASLMLVGPPGGEAQLLAAARAIEGA